MSKAENVSWSRPPVSSPFDSKSDEHWMHFDSSVNAISFGFVATAILISMFLVMAIFERFLRPRAFPGGTISGDLEDPAPLGTGLNCKLAPTTPSLFDMQGTVLGRQFILERTEMGTSEFFVMKMKDKDGVLIPNPSSYSILRLLAHCMIPSLFEHARLQYYKTFSSSHLCRFCGMMSVYAKGVSVLMPGQAIPTFIAHPAPLPCDRERVIWPHHKQNPFSNITQS